MTCQRYSELMIDILYGEEVRPRLCFEFFAHLGECTECRQEYIELIETREMLAQWEPEEITGEEVAIVRTGFDSRGSRRNWQWWSLLQKVAAGVLIAVGVFTVFQATGILPARDSAAVSEAQLTEVIHDVTLARQVEDWRVIGEALLELKEELEMKNQMEIRAVYEDMQNLEQRYVHALEESNRQVRTLMGR